MGLFITVAHLRLTGNLKLQWPHSGTNQFASATLYVRSVFEPLRIKFPSLRDRGLEGREVEWRGGRERGV